MKQFLEHNAVIWIEQLLEHNAGIWNNYWNIMQVYETIIGT